MVVCADPSLPDPMDEARIDMARRPESVDEFAEIDDEFSSWREGLSMEQRDSLESYTGFTHGRINRTLRGGVDPSDSAAKSIENLDDALKRSVMKQDTALFRFGEIPDVPPGAVWVDNGFVSTTMSERFAVETGRRQGQAVMEIIAPRGSRGASLRSISAAPDEWEVLLPRGTRFRVVERSRDRVVLEVLP